MAQRAESSPSNDRIIRRREVERCIGISKSALYRRIAEGTFPKPVTLSGGRAVGWIEREVAEFLARCISQRDQTVA